MDTSTSTIRDQVVDFVVTSFLFGDTDRLPDDDQSLVESGVIDSTGVLELIEYVEETFGIEVLEDETTPDNLDSIARIAAYVTRKTNGVGATPVSVLSAS